MKFRQGGRNRNLSLRSQLVVGGILILVVPMTVMVTVTFVKSSRALEEASRVQLVQTAQSIAGMIRIPLKKDLGILASLTTDSRVLKDMQSGDYKLTQTRLRNLYQMLTADYEGFAVFDAQGVIRADGLDDNRAGIVIAKRDYYLAAREGRASVGTMVFSLATGDPVFIICAPLKSEDGRFLGGIIGVLKADFLMRYIASIKLGATGYAFMIDQDGMVVAHPDPEYILKVDAGKTPGFEVIAERMAGQQTGTEEYTYRGVEKVVGFAPVELAGWSVAVTRDKDEIMALAYSNRNFMLMLSGVFLVLTILAVFFFSGKISEPVQTTLATLNHAVEQASEAFVIIGLDGKVMFANPAMAAMVDRPVQEIIGKPLQPSGTFDSNTKEIWNRVGSGDIWGGHITGTRKDMTRFTMDLTITPVRSKTGKLTGYLAIGRDISNELMMQERIRQSQKMEAIGTLAGGIAHDFNNILSAIFGYAELALAYPEDQNKLTGFLTEILNAAKRARELVDHILAFSRKADIDRKPVIPGYIIKEALKLLRASLPSTIEIQEDLNRSAAILGDPTQIHQITMNLCTNAGYAMRNQGGLLKVSLEELAVDEDAGEPNSGLMSGHRLRWTVTDSGPGIPPDILARIFDPFFTTKPPGEGTGLGLSAVHGIVKDLNGAIEVSSTPGEGTTFTIDLPVVRIDLHPADDVEAKLPGGGERILWVDDEAAIVESGGALLERLGYKTRTFTQSSEAWGYFAANPDAVDVVITDYTMPRMTGLELARKIRTVRRDIPIVICSGFLSFSDEMNELEPLELLKKPLTTRELALVVRHIIDENKNAA